MDGARSSNENRNLTGGPHVQEVLRAAQDELRILLQQRAEIMKRIGTVKQTIIGLANMFGDEVLSEDLLELVDRKSGGRQPGLTACATYPKTASGEMETGHCRATTAQPSGGRG